MNSEPRPAAGTPEWHEQRRHKLGTSEVAAILGLSPFASPKQIWLEKTGRLPPFEGSPATRAGQRLERAVLDQAEEDLGPLQRDVAVAAKSIDCPLVATLDGWATRYDEVVEAKTSGIVGPVYGEWGEEGSDVVPQGYLVQVAMQMLCTEAQVAHLYALLGGRGIIRYKIVRDDEVVDAIADQCSAWWQRHIEQGIEPEQDQPLPLEIVKRLRREPNKTVVLAEDALSAVARWEQAKEVANSAKKTADAAQSELLAYLGDAEAGTLPDGRVLRYGEQHRKAYEVAASTYRVLRVTKGSK